jgi:hypothetical protein
MAKGKTPARSRKSVRTAVAYAEARSPEPAAVLAEPGTIPEPAPIAEPVAVPEPASTAAPAVTAEAATPAPPVVVALEITPLPAPEVIEPGDPDSPWPAPGTVPPGNSRSMRRADRFALVYLHDTHLITRAGTVGRRGHWRVVEYPTVAAASRAYAIECSRLTLDGYVDVRE